MPRLRHLRELKNTAAYQADLIDIYNDGSTNSNAAIKIQCNALIL